MDPTSFTFLATILILVLLSASLVFRSYILRRRYRQRFQEALTDGLFADLDGYPRSTRRLGPKPVVWDTWIQLDKDATWSSITVSSLSCSIYRLAMNMFPTARCRAVLASAIAVINNDGVLSQICHTTRLFAIPTTALHPILHTKSLFSLSPSTGPISHRVPYTDHHPRYKRSLGKGRRYPLHMRAHCHARRSSASTSSSTRCQGQGRRPRISDTSTEW